jgi:GTPase SAR1 family protein
VTNVSTPDNSFVNKKPKEQVVEAKIILLGDSGVGKSSIGQRYCLDVFSEAHDVTIGAAYF